MKNDNAEIRFVKETGLCESPGVYIKVKRLDMAHPTMQAFGISVSIETAVDMMIGLVKAIEEYERWDNAESE